VDILLSNELHNANVEAFVHRSRDALDAGNVFEALNYASDALVINPDNISAKFIKAEIFNLLEAPFKSITLLEQIVEKDPNNIKALESLFDLNFRQRNNMKLMEVSIKLSEYYLLKENFSLAEK
jgi:tetratricopeptide (TPR) repeat protein